MLMVLTEDQMRAMENTLDRAEIEVSEGDPLDDEDEGAYLDNQRDVTIAKAVWVEIKEIIVVRQN